MVPFQIYLKSTLVTYFFLLLAKIWVISLVIKHNLNIKIHRLTIWIVCFQILKLCVLKTVGKSTLTSSRIGRSKINLHKQNWRVGYKVTMKLGVSNSWVQNYLDCIAKMNLTNFFHIWHTLVLTKLGHNSRKYIKYLWKKNEIVYQPKFGIIMIFRKNKLIFTLLKMTLKVKFWELPVPGPGAM